jgi:hypothetical protein
MNAVSFVLISVYSAILTAILVIKAVKHAKKREVFFEREYTTLMNRAKTAVTNSEITKLYADVNLFAWHFDSWSRYQSESIRYLRTFLDGKSNSARLLGKLT